MNAPTARRAHQRAASHVAHDNEAYFGTSSAALGREESAPLAAAIIKPRVLNAARPSARLRQRQQLLLRRMGGVTAGVPVRQGVPSRLPGTAGEDPPAGHAGS